MKKISDITEFNLFQEISKLGDVKIFSYVDAETMDLFYKSAYSERITAPIIDKMTIPEIAKIIYGFYANKWNTLIDYVLKANEVAVNLGSTETKQETKTGENNNNSTTTNTVSAYNTEDFSNNDKSENVSTGGNSENNQYTIVRTNNNSLTKNINYLKNVFIYDTVFSDVNNIIVLSIMDTTY